MNVGSSGASAQSTNGVSRRSTRVVAGAFKHGRDAVEGLVHGDTVPAWFSLAGGTSAVRLYWSA